MHGEFLQRSPAARAHHLKKRAIEGQDSQSNGAVANTLTAPVTLTVPVRGGLLKTSTTSSQLTVTTTTTIHPTSSTDTSSTLSSSQVVMTPSALPSPSPSTQPANRNNNSNNGAVRNSNSLPDGAIAGIVIVAILGFIGLLIFLVRKRFIRNRKKKRVTWGAGIMNKMATNGGDITPGVGGGAGEVDFENMDKSTSQGLMATTPFSSDSPTFAMITPPAMSYNNPRPVPVSAGGAASASGLTRIPVLPPNMATVQYTFIPSLPDELSITTGELIRILEEYDDGWALCVNGRGEQGMVPLECLDRGGEVPSSENRNSRRVSSLSAGADTGRY